MCKRSASKTLQKAFGLSRPIAGVAPNMLTALAIVSAIIGKKSEVTRENLEQYRK